MVMDEERDMKKHDTGWNAGENMQQQQHHQQQQQQQQNSGGGDGDTSGTQTQNESDSFWLGLLGMWVSQGTTDAAGWTCSRKQQRIKRKTMTTTHINTKQQLNAHVDSFTHTHDQYEEWWRLLCLWQKI